MEARACTGAALHQWTLSGLPGAGPTLCGGQARMVQAHLFILTHNFHPLPSN